MAEGDAQERVEPSLDPPPELNTSDVYDDDEGGLDGRKIVMFAILPLFVLLGVGGGLYFTGTFDKLFGKSEDEQHASDSHSKKDKDKKDGDDQGSSMHGAYFLEIPNMVVNLNTIDGDTRYLRLSVQLELDSQSDANAVEAVMPRVVDQFQTYLRELRVQDLRGSQGIYRLQMELLARVNAAAYPVEVKDVLFQEILIQ